VDRDDGATDLLQLGERRAGREVARVHDHARLVKRGETSLGKGTATAW
jgi:hypothetical protein